MPQPPHSKPFATVHKYLSMYQPVVDIEGRSDDAGSLHLFLLFREQTRILIAT